MYALSLATNHSSDGLSHGSYDVSPGRLDVSPRSLDVSPGSLDVSRSSSDSVSSRSIDGVSHPSRDAGSTAVEGRILSLSLIESQSKCS